MPLLDDGKEFDLFHGDCIPHLLRDMPEECVDFSIYSPPFPSVFSYTDSNADVGNVDAMDGEASVHLSFMFNGLYRVLKPGRAAIVHVAQIPRMKRSGGVGLCDFRGITLRLAERAGFIYEYDWSIRKNPQAQAIRTRSRELQFAGLESDRAAQRGTLQDYLIKIRKPGNNAVPIRDWDTDTNEDGDEVEVDKYSTQVSRNDWIKWAEGCWDDIQETDTLNTAAAKSDDDTRHICLASGSLVLTREYGYLEIEQVEVGDHVLTHKGRWMPVIAKKCNGTAETIRVCAQGVADLRLTPDHRLWTRFAKGSRPKEWAQSHDPEWVQAESTLGSYLNQQLPPEEDSELSEHEWWIIGRWLGDGHRGCRRTSGKFGGGLGQFFISCNHNEVEKLTLQLGSHAGHVAVRSATQIALIGLRNEVRDVLDRCGQGAENKRLPGEAVTLSQSKSEALLSGYLSADGHYVGKHDRFVASSVSRGLLIGMSLVAQRARGVVSSVYAGRPERDGVIEGREVKMRQDWIFAFRNSDGYKKSGWIDSLGAWKKVRKIEISGEAEVWDLQVAEDASFTAEGCIVHNCPLQIEVIRRCILLFSNPGEIVFSPFAGIGSEGYVALGGKSPKTGKYLHDPRRFYGCELKDEYYEQAKKNLASACANRASAKAMSLFDEDEGL